MLTFPFKMINFHLQKATGGVLNGRGIKVRGTQRLRTSVEIIKHVLKQC